MSYTVVWTPKAERLLTQLWIDADSPVRAQISVASREIDQRLKVNPEEEGESRPGGKRILFAAPLRVVFEVFPEDRQVKVAVAWRFATH